ncbi:MAG: hypothetical protein NZ602_14220 [Thermoguttaceae bacterium]|nr:hypothetical protein [Thermoguttaceae bacterium]MDW8039604.1 hypothetical protein [Thermoguttaceae bacterium]
MSHRSDCNRWEDSRIWWLLVVMFCGAFWVGGDLAGAGPPAGAGSAVGASSETRRQGASAAPATAGRVELVLLISPQAAITDPQTWARALAQAGIRQMQIRQASPLDQPGIERIGTDPPLYRVTGILTGQEVVLPGAKFRLDQVRQLARWLEELAVEGPPQERPPKAAFGLTAPQFEKVHADLAQPVGFATQGMDRAEAVARIGQKLQFPMQPAANRLPGLAGDKVAEELARLSCGTALACLLRPAGYALVPRSEGGRLLYNLERMRPGMEIWPVGWTPEKLPKDILPKLYEFLDVRLDRVSAAEALRAIADRLQVVYLMDHNALARHGIEPEKAVVSFPASRTYYAKVLERVLSQAGLKYEVRIDEAGTPFLWITTVKPL